MAVRPRDHFQVSFVAMRRLVLAFSAATMAHLLTPSAAVAEGPLDAAIYPDRVEAATLFGNLYTYAYYFADIYVGSPTSQRVSVIVDTGSSLCGFPCTDCEHCGEHLDPPFDPSASETAQYIPCDASCYDKCLDGYCSYEKAYAEGSSISGVWFRDWAQLGDLLRPNPKVNATLGCHLDERKLFYTQVVNGIMGLSPRATDQGKTTFLATLFQDHATGVDGAFSLCLAEWGGLLTVGGYNSSVHAEGAQLQWTPMDMQLGYYSIRVTVLNLGGVDLVSGADAFGNTVVDSGTSYTYLPPEVYNTVYAALEAACATSPGCGAVLDKEAGEGCWKLDGSSDLPVDFPSMAFGLEGGASTMWPAHAYLYRLGDSATWCTAFAANSDQSGTVLGISWLLHQEVVFDLVAERLGVAPSNCPQHHRPPGWEAYSDRVTDATGTVTAFALLGSALCCCLALGIAWRSFFRRKARDYETVSNSD